MSGSEIFAGNEFVHGGGLLDNVSKEMLVFIGLAAAFLYVYKVSDGNVRNYMMNMFGMKTANMADFRRFDAQIGDGRHGGVTYNNSY
jgi:hypothetical protein